MNKYAHPAGSDRGLSPDYEQDGFGWAMHQSELLRARQAEAIDWHNVAEEIESMGKHEMRAAESRLRVALIHVLKWQHQPALRGRSWSASVREHLRRFDRILSKNPSLKPHLDHILSDAYSDARFDASQETGLDMSTFPEQPPSWDEIRAPLPD